MGSMAPLVIVAGSEHEGSRLESLLRLHLPGVSRGAIRRLIESGAVLVDGRRARKGTLLRPGQRVTWLIERRDEAPVPQPELPLAILATTADLVAIEKPAGQPCHPLIPGERGTVANALVARFPECGSASPSPREAGLVHRLDRGTSGVLLAARSRAAHERLRGRFSAGEVIKHYLALVSGHIEADEVMRARLRRAPGDPGRMTVCSPLDAGGQEAETRLSPGERLGELSLVRASCRSGRRHQVRVHLAAAGHPLAGDSLYGGPLLEALAGPFLHAERLEIPADELELSAALPSEHVALLERLRQAAGGRG